MNNMTNPQFLKFLINEDIYKIDQEGSAVEYDLQEPKEQNVAEPISETIIKSSDELAVYKSILVVVEDPTNVGLNLKDKQYLAKILSAVNADLHKISLVNIHKNEIEGLTGVEQILVFTPNSTFGVANTLYELNTLDDAKIIISDPLDQVSQSVELRKSLWEALQKMFA